VGTGRRTEDASGRCAKQVVICLPGFATRGGDAAKTCQTYDYVLSKATQAKLPISFGKMRRFLNHLMLTETFLPTHCVGT
jgi:hypothetical protein